MSVERKADLGRRWAELFADVEKCLDDDPAGPRAQELAGRWMDLLLQTRGCALRGPTPSASARFKPRPAYAGSLCLWRLRGFTTAGSPRPPHVQPVRADNRSAPESYRSADRAFRPADPVHRQ